MTYVVATCLSEKVKDDVLFMEMEKVSSIIFRHDAKDEAYLDDTKGGMLRVRNVFFFEDDRQAFREIEMRLGLRKAEDGEARTEVQGAGPEEVRTPMQSPLHPARDSV